MQTFWVIWEKVAELRLWERVAIKSIMFVGVLIVVLYPNPLLLGQQLRAYVHTESLIQPAFAGMDRINQDIDGYLSPDATREHEFRMIQRYVYEHIPYVYDWENWGNIDFWPTAEQVWERRKEDCDGRAILAVSILRARGFTAATLVGNIRHIWVEVDQDELMGPDRERTLSRVDGKTRINLPSAELLLGSIALHIADFPTIRNLILLFTIMLLGYHPCKNLTGLFALSTMGLMGFILFKDWARHVMNTRSIPINFDFIGGCSLLCIALILSFFMQRIIQQKCVKRDA